MNAPALENLEKEKKLLENLEKEKELLERFCLFFFAKEKEKSTKDGKMIEFNLRDGSRLVVFGKSAGYMPGEFVKKSLEGVCGVIESVGEINIDTKELAKQINFQSTQFIFKSKQKTILFVV